MWANNVQEVTILLMVVLAALAVAMPRKYMLVAFVIAACFVPTDQRLVIVGFDFTVLRVLVLAGVFRIIVRASTVRWRGTSSMFLCWRGLCAGRRSLCCSGQALRR